MFLIVFADAVSERQSLAALRNPVIKSDFQVLYAGLTPGFSVLFSFWHEINFSSFIFSTPLCWYSSVLTEWREEEENAWSKRKGAVCDEFPSDTLVLYYQLLYLIGHTMTGRCYLPAANCVFNELIIYFSNVSDVKSAQALPEKETLRVMYRLSS